jgi:Protein of unknown function (DUF917)
VKVERLGALGIRIAFKNEFLIADRDGEAIVTPPDMITLLEAEIGVPVTADAAHYGIRVVAIAYPCWRTPGGLALVVLAIRLRSTSGRYDCDSRVASWPLFHLTVSGMLISWRRSPRLRSIGTSLCGPSGVDPRSNGNLKSTRGARQSK